jgi:hypothetical protein
MLDVGSAHPPEPADDGALPAGNLIRHLNKKGDYERTDLPFGGIQHPASRVRLCEWRYFISNQLNQIG